MNKRLSLNRADIRVIQEKLDKFPNIDPFILEYNNASGIGYTLDILIETETNGVKGEFRIPVVTPEEW
jgi:hypothetical protein